jgi:hypothetical protein
MRSGHHVVAGLSLAAMGVAVAVAASAPATAGSSRVSPMHRSAQSALVSAPLAAGSTCARQDDNDNGVGVISQNFEADFDAYDSRGADDFTIKRRCEVREVDVNGAYFTGIGPAISVHVTFYQNDGSTPGRRIVSQNDLDYRDPSGLGNFEIPLAASVTFQPGRYWVAVRANIDFRDGGEWGWNTNNTLRGSIAQWKNAGDGFDTGCTTWGDVKTCLGDDEGQGPDFSFALLK